MIQPFIEFGDALPGYRGFGAVLDGDCHHQEVAVRIIVWRWTVAFGLRRARYY